MSNPLLSHLELQLAQAPAARLCVALSGGPDSVALLHALAALPAARARGLRAMHVDHRLHPHSAEWSDRCAQLCATLSVPFVALAVDVQPDGRGIEAAAREARYAALAARLGEGEYLVTAHHRDDQVETVLLKLLRGAGPEGLGGMRERRALGAGQLWRPLLALPRAVLRDYVSAHGLRCIDDPANATPELARNVLRHEILPRLARHWPHAADSVQHSAALCRAAADALRTQWLAALAELHDPATGSLDATGWLALAPGLREPLLDHWLHARHLPAPTTVQRRQIERQCHARAGQLPCVRWPGAELHIWKGRLWALPPQQPIDARWEMPWHGEVLSLPGGGTLSLRESARLATPLRVRLRRGGEQIRPAGDRHTRELRDLFQQGQLPPWQRPACPLLYADDELVAVADRWLSARGVAIFDQAGSRPCWRPTG
jgi:tRNA(Ile)-lysidine synthase